MLAVGHSARAVYAWAAAAGIAIERKPIAVGVRIEHPQRAHRRDSVRRARPDTPQLPPAFYELAPSVDERGVYSFCMCPGGWIVPAATEPDGVVVNGMSLSRRDSPFANAGLVVSVAPTTSGPLGAGPLAGVEFQRGIERSGVSRGGRAVPGARRSGWATSWPVAPAARWAPRATGRALRPPTSAAVLSRRSSTEALRDGLRQIGARLPAFLLPDALLIGRPRRAPARRCGSLRDPATLGLAVASTGSIPAAKGPATPGGIVSAALDGARVAERILAAG